MKQRKSLLPLLLIFALSACTQPTAAPSVTPLPPTRTQPAPSDTITPSPVPPTATVTPSPVPSETPTPTPTITATPIDLSLLQVISPENASQLVQIGQWQQDGYVRKLTFSPDGQTLAVGYIYDDRAFINLWDVSTGELLLKLNTDSRFVDDLAFSPDGQTIAAATSDTVQLWDVSTGELLVPPIGSDSFVFSLAYNPNGKTLAYGYAMVGSLLIWDLQNERLLFELEADVHDVISIAFTPDGSRLISGGRGSMLRIWNPDTGELLQEIGIYGNPETINGTPFVTGYTILKVATAPGRSFAISACAADCIVQIRDVDTGALIHQITEYSGVNQAVFSPDGRILLLRNCSQSDGGLCLRAEIVLLDTVDFGLITRIENNGITLAIDPYGQLVAVGDEQGFVFLLGIPDQYP